jgi:hypothetical protein
VGVAYDVFGNGRTALKFNYGKYLAYAANDSPYTSTNPGATVVRNVINRQWNASVAAGGNGDFVVNCNLLNPAANGECAAATGTALNFGQLGAATAVDPNRAERLGRASWRRSVHVYDAAASGAAHVRGVCVHPPLVARLLRDRRPDSSREHQLVL